MSPGVLLKRAHESLSVLVFADSAAQGTHLKCSCSHRVYFYFQPHLEAKIHKFIAKPDNSLLSSYVKGKGENFFFFF